MQMTYFALASRQWLYKYARSSRTGVTTVRKSVQGVHNKKDALKRTRGLQESYHGLKSLQVRCHQCTGGSVEDSSLVTVFRSVVQDAHDCLVVVSLDVMSFWLCLHKAKR
jgi:hypothetical protein